METNWSLARRRTTLEARAVIIREIRRFFHDGGYLEVETPLRIPSPAPESHIDAIPSDGWFLHTSPELCMKRMLAAGFEKIFQICHCWRSDERGGLHLPEFTMLEWYRTGTDYTGLMDDCESLLQRLTAALGQEERLIFKGRVIDVSSPWERIPVRDAFLRYGGISMEQALARDLFDEIMVKDIEPHLGMDKPVIIHDYPAERSALARLRSDDPSVAERFELYVGGLELSNAFSELTDQREQRNRFLAEQEFRRSRGKTDYPLPEKFLAELPAMPPSAGIALGIDRLVMVLLDKQSIDEVVAFTPEEL
ncbi:MAG TPA: EF-P lysine aminoacylase EpmA [Geobacteraceae bacterium]|nr:EF-P lysine aminoacylase EpmA [Geobacteraceae bacterium]